MTSDLQSISFLSIAYTLWCHKLTKPWSAKVAHIRSTVLLLREESYISLGEVHAELFAFLGQDLHDLPQNGYLLLVFYLETHVFIYSLSHKNLYGLSLVRFLFSLS
jgi:hypothetical protein